MQILSLPLRGPRTIVVGGSSPPRLQRQSSPGLPPLLLPMEQDALVEQMDFDEHQIPTVFFLNVDNLEGEGDERREDLLGFGHGEDGDHFTHHYSVEEDGSIHYHHPNQNRGDGGNSPSEDIAMSMGLGNYNVLEDGDNLNHFEFEEITPMPTTSEQIQNIEICLQPNIGKVNNSLGNISSSTSILTLPVTSFTTAFAQTKLLSTEGRSANGLAAYEPPRQGFMNSNALNDSNGHVGTTGTNVKTNKRKSNAMAGTNYSGNLSWSNSSEGNHSLRYKEKKPKLLVNLYEEEVGWEYGCLSNDGFTVSYTSHLLPYGDGGESDAFLEAVDREEVPVKSLTADLKRHLMWRRGHILAEIRDYRGISHSGSSNNPFFVQRSHSSKRMNVNAKPRNSSDKQRLGNSCSTINNAVSEGREPVIRHVLLRPTTNGLLADFERLLERSKRARERWMERQVGQGPLANANKVVPYQVNGFANGGHRLSSSSEDDHDGDDGSEKDSDYEIELDLESSLCPESEDFTYDEKLELEKEFINKTAGPLCLDPSPSVAVIQNRIQFERLKWRCPTLMSKRRLNSTVGENEEEKSTETVVGTPQESIGFFTKFLTVMREKDILSGRGVKDDPFKWGVTPFQEYPNLQAPSSMEDIERLAPLPEPCMIRPLAVENIVKKVEEYTLETERRKRPHTTKLSIFQRNNTDSFFGELEMEAMISEPNANNNNLPILQNKPGKESQPSTNSTKCQFELGSATSVALYVKQFSDIFTEDGRRPCKITYQKVGQPTPQVLYTNSYKTPAPPGASLATGATVTLPTASVSGSVSGQGTPPVQIVNPMPRAQQQESPSNTNQPQIQTQTATVTGPSVNFNLSINSPAQSPVHQQQMLTRPQNMNIVGMPSSAASSSTTTSAATAPPASSTLVTHQQILQQRLQRLKQQQQQQQQQPQTALAKLLLTNIQGTQGGSSFSPSSSAPSNTPSRPITVAVQPQPQKAMVTVTPNTNTGDVSSSGLSQSQAAMIVDGLRGQQILRVTGQQAVNQVSGGISLPSSIAQSMLTSGGQLVTTSTVQPQQRQYTSGQNIILQGSQQQQRILINANNGQQFTVAATSTQSCSNASGVSVSEEEISVPDLSSLLASSATPGGPLPVSSLQASHLTQHHSSHPQLTHMPADTHNVNLNLNVNLNSGSVLTGDSIQTQGGVNPPPFLVFISPLRSVPVSINTTRQHGGTHTTLLQQHLEVPTIVTSVSGPGLIVHPQQHQQSQQPQIHIQTHNQTDGVSSSGSGNNGIGNFDEKNIITLEAGGGSESLVRGHIPSSSPSTVVINNSTYTLTTTNQSQPQQLELRKDPGGITLSDLLGSPSSQTSVNISPGGIGHSNRGSLMGSGTGVNTSMNQNSGIGVGVGLGLGLGVHQHQQQQQQQAHAQTALPRSMASTLSSTVMSSTPRLSALLAGTPSADTSTSSPSIPPGSGKGNNRVSGISPASANDSRTLLDRLTASLSSSSGTTPSPTARSGLNPIATATPSVVLDHPVLAATLTGGQPTPPKILSTYRQIAPAPNAGAKTPQNTPALTSPRKNN